MDVNAIIQALVDRRNQLDQAIQLLNGAFPRQRGRGRPPKNWTPDLVIPGKVRMGRPPKKKTRNAKVEA